MEGTRNQRTIEEQMIVVYAHNQYPFTDDILVYAYHMYSFIFLTVENSETT